MLGRADFAILARKESDLGEFLEVLVLGALPTDEVIAAKMAIRRAWGARRESEPKEKEKEMPVDTKKTSGDSDLDSGADLGTEHRARRVFLDEFRKRRLFNFPYNRSSGRGLTVINTTDAPPCQ